MATHFTPITTTEFSLRTIVAGDIDQVFTGLSHPAVIKYYGVNYQSLEATTAQMAWFDELLEKGIGIWLAITSPDGSIFYGAIGLSNLTDHRKAELGFWLLPRYWGLGLMTKAAALVCDFGFSQLALHRIEAFVETPNRGSSQLLQKLGFKHEGTMMDCEIKNGDFISLDIYAKFRPIAEE